MVMRLVLLVVVVIAIVGIFASFTSSAAMMGIFQYIPTPILTVAYAALNHYGNHLKNNLGKVL